MHRFPAARIPWSTLLLLSLHLSACEPSALGGEEGEEKGEGRAKALPVIAELWNASKPKKMERILLEILPAARTADQPEYLAELLAQLARTRVHQKRLKEAKANLDEAEAIIEAGETEEMLRPRAIWLVETGRYLRFVRLFEHDDSAQLRARTNAVLEEAYNVALAAGDDFVAVDAAHQLGKIDTSQKGLDWNLEAIRISRGSSQPRVSTWLGVIYETATRGAARLENYDQALELSQAGLAWSREHGDEGRAEPFATNIDVLEKKIRKQKQP